MNLVLSAGVCLLTLALILVRPGGLSEAFGALIGAILTLLLRLASPADVRDVLMETGNVLLFLLGMMIVTGVCEIAGCSISSRTRWHGGSARAAGGS